MFLMGMFEDNIISKELAVKTSLQPLVSKKFKENSKIYAPYFIEEVRRQVIDKYEENAYIKKGYMLLLLLILDCKEAAIQSLRNGLEDYDKRHRLERCN